MGLNPEGISSERQSVSSLSRKMAPRILHRQSLKMVVLELSYLCSTD